MTGLRTIGALLIYATGAALLGTAWQLLPMIKPNAWPFAAAIYALVAAATISAAFTLRDIVTGRD